METNPCWSVRHDFSSVNTVDRQESRGTSLYRWHQARRAALCHSVSSCCFAPRRAWRPAACNLQQQQSIKIQLNCAHVLEKGILLRSNCFTHMLLGTWAVIHVNTTPNRLAVPLPLPLLREVTTAKIH
jgi:hypothetical protein